MSQAYDTTGGSTLSTTDAVGASDSEMEAAVARFNAAYNQFETAANKVSADVQTLAGTWVGDGYDEFTIAMGKWTKDITAVNNNLSSMTRGIQESNTAIHETDNNIGAAFRQY